MSTNTDGEFIMEIDTDVTEDNNLIRNIITYNRSENEIENPELYEDNVLIIGDSILKQVGHVRNAVVRSYRGDTIEDLNHHLQNDGEQLLYNKKIIVIHAGTNDLYSLTIEEMLEDLETLVKTILEKSNTWVYCVAFSAILPRPKDYWTSLMKIRKFNAAVKASEDTIGIRFLRTWRPFSRKHLPRKFMFKRDALHPSDKGAMRMSQYLAKQCSLIRKEHHIPRNKRAASKTIVSKKPWGGYGYPGARERHRILYKPHGDLPKEPTYGTTPKDIHRPSTSASTILKTNTRTAIKKMRASLEGCTDDHTSVKELANKTAGNNKNKTMSSQRAQPLMNVKTGKPLKNGGKKKTLTLRMKKHLKKVVEKLEKQANQPKKELWEHGEPCVTDIRILDSRNQDRPPNKGRKYMDIYLDEQNMPQQEHKQFRMAYIENARIERTKRDAASNRQATQRKEGTNTQRKVIMVNKPRIQEQRTRPERQQIRYHQEHQSYQELPLRQYNQHRPYWNQRYGRGQQNWESRQQERNRWGQQNWESRRHETNRWNYRSADNHCRDMNERADRRMNNIWSNSYNYVYRR